MASEERFVELIQVRKEYPTAQGTAVTIVDEVDLMMRRGEILSLIGHSGCGKSTLLTMVAGLNPLSGGNIVVDGCEVTGPGPDRAVVFQSPCLMPWMTALQNVLLGVQRVFPDRHRQETVAWCTHYLELVGLGHALHQYPREMSGGMQQRVGVARALALQPKVLLLDEPFGRLDSLTRMELQDVVLEILDQEQITTIIVTHDVDEAILMSDRVCMLTSGPRARIGQVLELPWERPREREQLLQDPLYYDFRGCLVTFLELQDRTEARQQDRQSIDWTEAYIHKIVRGALHAAGATETAA